MGDGGRVQWASGRLGEALALAYVEDPRSMSGRFVNSDLMKETFEEYRESNETHNRYNAPVHNAAAVLAAEQFRRAISDRSDLERDVALFLTGVWLEEIYWRKLLCILP